MKEDNKEEWKEEYEKEKVQVVGTVPLTKKILNPKTLPSQLSYP